MKSRERSSHPLSKGSSLAARFLLLAACIAPFAACATTPEPKAEAPSFRNVENVIDEMLAEQREAVKERSPSKTLAPPPVKMPEVKGGGVFPEASAPREDSTDTFNEDVVRIQEAVPTWNNGTGIALKFLREASGKRVSLIYVDPTPPVFKADAGHWLISATARTDTRTLGHFVLLLKDLTPGRYTGSASDDAVVMSTSMGNDWIAEDPDTTWSVNEESWCELVLEAGEDPAVLEGHFRAKLIDNQGTGFHRIESGYIFIKR